jgi:hypothetical protein
MRVGRLDGGQDEPALIGQPHPAAGEVRPERGVRARLASGPGGGTTGIASHREFGSILVGNENRS